MTNKNYFFSEDQVELSKEFFKESDGNKIRVENMLEKFGYSYKYEKVIGIRGEYIFISIYASNSSYLGTFLYKDFFDDYGICLGIYNLLENFGYVIRELKK